jgi:two-component system chemotaxis response regulator CheB
MKPNSKIRVLVVDDSAIVRKILSETINAESDMEVVATAPDPYIARDKILALRPDVLTLDIEMPRMDGLTFLKKIMQSCPMPVIIISSLAQSSCEISMEALQQGAVEVMAKPGGPYSIGDLKELLPAKLRAAAHARVRRRQAAAAPEPPKAVRTLTGSSFSPETIVAIGASTGGTEAIHSILKRLPADSPAMVLTQHIPREFSQAFAQRLNRDCAVEVREALDGDEVRPGLALIAPGDFHMLLRKNRNRLWVELQQGPKVCYQRPAVDVMFSSVATAAGKNAVGILLTGMGSDGAQGLLRMRESGATTVAQDEASCVVYGMPREAFRAGAVEQVLPLTCMAEAILREASRKCVKM